MRSGLCRADAKAKPLRQPPFGDHDGAGDDIAGVGRHHRADVVVAQQFDGALSAPVRAGDEHDEIAALLCLANVGDPVGNAAVKRRHRLRGDGRCAFVEPELFENRGVGKVPVDLLAREHQLGGRRFRYAFLPGFGFGMLRLRLLPRRVDVFVDISWLCQQQLDAASGQILKQIRR